MRIRTVKPEFWSHPVMVKQDDATKLLAIGLLNFADDEGFFFADPRIIRGALRPLDEDSSIIRRALESLSCIGYIELREHSSHGPVGRVTNFTAHQRVDRPSKSKIREFFETSSPRDAAQPENVSTSAQRTFAEVSPVEQGTGSRERGNGKEQPSSPAAPTAQAGLELGPVIRPATTAPLVTAEAIYQVYPRKQGKADALKAIEKAMKSVRPQMLLERTMAYATAVARWSDHDRQFIPYPATWFSRGSYDDDPRTWERNYSGPNQQAAPTAEDHARESWSDERR